jgi:uncharacterized protein YecE (DUF72 family)
MAPVIRDRPDTSARQLESVGAAVTSRQPGANVRVGTAGWSIPRASASRFDSAGTHLQRYAGRLRCAEINSSFYRPHSATTYAKWRDSTPADFRFSVKMPRAITHELKLQDAREPLRAFLSQTDGLSEKRGPLLIQLPPSLSFEPDVVASFLRMLRRRYDGPVVCEPRHPSWFSLEAAALLDRHRIARVAADPAPAPAAGTPAGWAGIAYFRLHGSPRTYWSRYDETSIATLATAAHNLPDAREVWCIFDNTASGAAIENAAELQQRLVRSGTARRRGSGRAP